MPAVVILCIYTGCVFDAGKTNRQVIGYDVQTDRWTTDVETKNNPERRVMDLPDSTNTLRC